jgi:ergothioneine biosynthesis protein EgtB
MSAMPQTVHRTGTAQTAPRTGTADHSRRRWLEAFRAVRTETERRAALLSPEDQQIQSMSDASPTKWHRAHTTWFFEQFVLMPNLTGYKVFDERFAFLFNSYYVAAGPRHARPQRGLVSRPSNDDVAAFRSHVDAAVERLIESAPPVLFDKIVPVLEIGLHHEQQHTELLWTDILHAFAQNPTDPIYDANWRMPRAVSARGFAEIPTGVHFVGHRGEGFHFDNEAPAHRELIEPVKISRGLVTNSEWLEFIADGGYSTPSLWLSDAWATVQTEGWKAPGYWREKDGVWFQFTLGGLRPVDKAGPVAHVSYYEADAFARWSGKHLPSEAEWEVAARHDLLDDAFGIVWQWTRSAYLPYPGYRAPAGAIGEYNGKFMVNQMVLRGSSLATPDGHARLTYRNFFYPPHRWQFAGLRLAQFGV